MPPTSFRFRLTADALVLGSWLVRPTSIRAFHPKAHGHAGHTGPATSTVADRERRIQLAGLTARQATKYRRTLGRAENDRQRVADDRDRGATGVHQGRGPPISETGPQNRSLPW